MLANALCVIASTGHCGCWADGKLCSSVLETVHWSLGGAAAYRGAVVGPTVHVGGQMIGQCV